MSVKFIPPKLPAYLASMFELNPIIGAPSDDEVKNVHAVIRAVDTASQLSAWNDPGLSMELAQHLFDIQMARYRERYPVNIFPWTNTYTPPTLPSHISILLEPINGAPTDDEAKLVHTALRASENLVNLPSVYDPDLSMNLSQHLFDILLDRHIRRTIEGHYTTRDASNNLESNEKVPTETPQIAVCPKPDSNPIVTSESPQGDPAPEQAGSPEIQIPRPESLDASFRTTALTENTDRIIEQLKNNLEQTDLRLVGVQDAVQSITRLMVKLHNHSARGFNSGHDYRYHHIVSENGEAPMNCEVPAVENGGGQTFWKASDGALAQYLQFYNIGTHLIEKGDPPTLKPNSNEQASRILGRYTHTRP